MPHAMDSIACGLDDTAGTYCLEEIEDHITFHQQILPAQPLLLVIMTESRSIIMDGQSSMLLDRRSMIMLMQKEITKLASNNWCCQ